MKKKIYSLFVLFLFSLTIIESVFAEIAQKSMILPIVEIYDGDTIKTDLTWRLPSPLNVVYIRVRGIDTPERGGRASCEKEKQLAEAAKQYVITITQGQTKMKITNFGWDKFGGRIDADVNVGGIDIATALIANKLAVSYNGIGPKFNWCQ